MTRKTFATPQKSLSSYCIDCHAIELLHICYLARSQMPVKEQALTSHAFSYFHSEPMTYYLCGFEFSLADRASQPCENYS